MRKLAFVFLSIFLISTAFGQDKRAGDILDQMSRKYQGMKTFSASFTYGAEGARVYRGDIVANGIKFKLNMAGQEIMNNGKEIYTYMPDVNEVNITEFNPTQDDMFTPSKIYSIYKKGYKYTFKGEEKEGSNVLEVVELVPTKKNSNVSKVQIKVTKKDKSIRSWKIWDNNNKATVFKVSKFIANVAAPDALFTFDSKKHPGVEVVDLR